eukprot:jgi/Tetstr1/456776/TSEL_004143.t1
MDVTGDATAVLASRRSFEALRSSAGLPSEQADLALGALQAAILPSLAGAVPPEPGGPASTATSWANLPDEVNEQIFEAAQLPVSSTYHMHHALVAAASRLPLMG